VIFNCGHTPNSVATVDKKKPDRYEILGSLIVVIGATIILYAPR
jgi:drug/metabolite transporter superfamily protein YnfA